MANDHGRRWLLPVATCVALLALGCDDIRLVATVTRAGSQLDGGPEGGRPRDAGGDGSSAGDGASLVCRSVQLPVERVRTEVDVILSVDGSSSMEEEIGLIQSELSAFLLSLTAQQTDARILLVSRAPDDDRGICLPAPLGSGNCEDDSRPPTYVHATGLVGNLAFDSILSSSIYEQYEPYLRAGSDKHLVLFTDNDGVGTDTAEELNAEVLERDSRFAGYRFHAVVPLSDGCGNQGELYPALVALTGGVSADLCANDYSPVFDQLSTAVVDNPNGCRWEVPAPPEGLAFERTRVNVDLVGPTGGRERVGFVEDRAACDRVQGQQGWYYDDSSEPREMVACPQTCAHIRSLAEGTLAIEFGCVREPAVII